MESVLSGRDTSFESDGDGEGLQLTEDAASPEATLGEREEEERVLAAVQGALGTLQPRERCVVERRFLSSERTTLAGIGRSLGVSRERVRQIEQRAVERIRDAVNA
jgi:RNA polymerase sigma-32 factor